MTRALKSLLKNILLIKNEFISLVQSLKEKPEQGTALGNNCYKIRIAVKSKGKGKSGGARVVTNFIIADHTVFLLSIYDKADKENLTDKELKELLQLVPN